MSYKSILICPSSFDGTQLLSNVACQIANQRDDSRILGVHWIPNVQEFSHGERVSGQINADIDVPMINHVRSLANEFYLGTVSAHCPSEWMSLGATDEQANNIVVDYSRCADLVIAEQPTSDNIENTLAFDLIVGSGKPVLVIPPESKLSLPFDQALIAWNSTKTSARAAFDALPLLKHCVKTETIWIDDADPEDELSQGITADFIAALKLHDVTTDVKRIGKPESVNGSIGAQVLQRADQLSADFMVAGAASQGDSAQSRLSTTSMELLTQSRNPILFSG